MLTGIGDLNISNGIESITCASSFSIVTTRDYNLYEDVTDLGKNYQSYCDQISSSITWQITVTVHLLTIDDLNFICEFKDYGVLDLIPELLTTGDGNVSFYNGWDADTDSQGSDTSTDNVSFNSSTTRSTDPQQNYTYSLTGVLDRGQRLQITIGSMVRSGSTSIVFDGSPVTLNFIATSVPNLVLI